MANALKLTPKNVTQWQLDCLVAIRNAANPVICNAAVSGKTVTITSKDYKTLALAEKVFSEGVE